MPPAEHPRKRTCRAPIWLALSLAAACTPPHFPEEADGDPVETLPDWAEPLLGTYALTGHSFVAESPLTVLTRLRAQGIATFSKDSDARVTLSMETCSLTSDSNILDVTAYLLKPKARELNVHRVRFDLATKTWQSTPISPAYFGADELQPEACRNRTELNARPEQTWLETCSCRYEGAPKEEDDCRLRDPDEDGVAGFTIKREDDPSCGDTGATEANVIEHVEGEVDPSGQQHSARYAGFSKPSLYADQSTGVCKPSPLFPLTLTPCPTRYQVVTFKRVAPDASCDALMDREQEVFEPAPPFPNATECL